MGVRAFLIAVAGVTASCGLGITGAGPAPSEGASAEAGASTDGSAAVETGSPVDASTADEPAPASPCTTAGSACVGALAAGWTPLAFAADRAQTCPANYTQVDLVTSPAAAADACTCSCTIAAGDPPSCAKGSVSSLVGNANCNQPGATYTFNGTGCTAIGTTATVSNVGKHPALPLTAGTCTPSAVKNAGAVTSTAVRACQPPPACAEDVCQGQGPAAFGSCIAHDGEVACPAGPFAHRSLAGATAALTCGGCATCQNSGTCGPASIVFYSDNACAAKLASRVVDDTCNTLTTGTAGGAASHVRYESAVLGATCAMTSTPTTAVGLDAPRTICCR